MIAISDLYDEWSYGLPLVTPARFEAECRFTARDLCSCKLWEADLDAFVSTSARSYDLVSQYAQSEVFAVSRLMVGESILYDGSPRSGRDSQMLAKNGLGNPPFSMSSDGTSLTFIDGVTVEAGAQIRIRAYLRPSRLADVIPDFLGAHDYFDALKNGTFARLMEVPGQSSANPEAGRYHRNMYETMKRKLMNMNQQGNTLTPIRVRSWGP